MLNLSEYYISKVTFVNFAAQTHSVKYKTGVPDLLICGSSAWAKTSATQTSLHPKSYLSHLTSAVFTEQEKNGWWVLSTALSIMFQISNWSAAVTVNFINIIKVRHSFVSKTVLTTWYKMTGQDILLQPALLVLNNKKVMLTQSAFCSVTVWPNRLYSRTDQCWSVDGS